MQLQDYLNTVVIFDDTHKLINKIKKNKSKIKQI